MQIELQDYKRSSRVHQTGPHKRTIRQVYTRGCQTAGALTDGDQRSHTGRSRKGYQPGYSQNVSTRYLDDGKRCSESRSLELAEPFQHTAAQSSGFQLGKEPLEGSADRFSPNGPRQSLRRVSITLS